MAVVSFFTGLAIGIGFWIWRRARLRQQLQQVLRALQADSEVSLPVISRLRREMTLASQHRQQLEIELSIWKSVLQNAPFGYLQVDDENQLLWCNHQARQLLNIQKWEPSQVRLLLEVVRSYELDRLIERTRRQRCACQQDWVFHLTASDILAKGNQTAIALRGYGWPLPEGQVGIFLENRQVLVELSSARDRWMSDLAHELRTPLTSIRLVAETLQDRLEPSLRQWVSRLLKEVNRLIGLVQDWLELSHMEANSDSALLREPLELGGLIRSVWQTLEPLAQQKQLALTYVGPDSLWIEADESRLYRALINLLDNSIKYSDLKGEIRVEAAMIPLEDAPDLVRIDIVDAGTGFPEADLPYIFERFFRADPARSRDSLPLEPTPDLAFSAPSQRSTASAQEPSLADATPILSAANRGSGLGLAIVQKIILAHGGAIKACNHPETGGAWVQIDLPCSATKTGVPA